MDIDLNKALQFFQSARTLQKDDIKNLSQKDRKILSVLMTTILKSKGGCTMENIGENDLNTLLNDIQAGPPKDEQESGVVDKIGNFFKNIFSKKISSKSLFDKIKNTNTKVALLIKNENEIKENKTKIENIINIKTKEVEEQEKTLEAETRCSEHLVYFLKTFDERMGAVSRNVRVGAVESTETNYTKKLNEVDPASREGKSYQECLTTLKDLKEALQARGTKGATTFIKDYFNSNNLNEKEKKRQIKKSKKEIENLKQQVAELANQEAIINKLKEL